jgi:hypothetical protein
MLFPYSLSAPLATLAKLTAPAGIRGTGAAAPRESGLTVSIDSLPPSLLALPCNLSCMVRRKRVGLRVRATEVSWVEV